MNPSLKSAIIYFVLIVLTFFLIRGYDYITKKPTPVDRSANPEIVRLDSMQHHILSLVVREREMGDSARGSAKALIASMKIDHIKSKKQHETLKNTPDSLLNHIRDSIKIANGIK